MDGQHFSELVSEIYEAATDPAPMKLLAPAIARAFGTHSAALDFRKRRNGSLEFNRILAMTDNHDRWAQKAYGDYYFARDPWFKEGIKKPLNTVVIGEELVSERDYERSEFWTDFASRSGSFHLLGLSFPVLDVIGAVGLHRARNAAPFGESDRRTLTILLPHLRGAFVIHRRLQIAERNTAATASLFDNLGVGVILVDAAGQMLFANAQADRSLQAADGLTAVQGRLRTGRSDTTERLHRMIGEAAGTSNGNGESPGGLLRIRLRTGDIMTIFIAPFRVANSRWGVEEPTAIVVLSKANPVDPHSEIALCSAFNLTAAEARLAAALAAGESLSDYTNRNGISMNTAKTQLRQVFAKTNCSRQAELVRMLYADLAIRLASLSSR